MNHAHTSFLRGFQAQLPILVGVIPFGLIYGVSAINAGISPLATVAMSIIVLGGSAQIVMTKLIGAGTPPLVTIITACIVNLRHMLYSASISPFVQHLGRGWKGLLAYFLTDEAYAVAITHYQAEGDRSTKHWYFLGAGMALWSSWLLSTLVGVVLGAQLPESWSLDFTIALTFIALVVPMLQDRASIIAATTASCVAIVAALLPYKIDLIVATFVGIGAAVVVEHVEGKKLQHDHKKEEE